MVEKANLTGKDKEKIKALLDLDNVIEFMSLEESDEGQREETAGPPPRHVKPLEWERLKLKNIKAVVDSTYKARMTKRQKRTAAKESRFSGHVSNRSLPHNILQFVFTFIYQELIT